MSSPFQRALREELLRAARRSRATTSRRVVVALVATLAAVATSVVALLNPSPASADVEITVEDGRVEVRLTDLTTTPAEVRDAFEKAGLEAEIVGLAAGPSNAGRFVQVQLEGGGLQPVERNGESGTSFTGFSVPEDWKGTLTIGLGRRAEGGEPYAVASNAFAEGEPLRCAGVLGSTLQDARPALSGLSVRVQLAAEGAPGPPVDLEAVDLTAYGRWVIVSGNALSAQDVLLQIQAELRTDLSETGC